MQDKGQSLQGDKMNRRGFLKGLGAVVSIPIAIKAVAAKPELTNLEKAEKIDKDFTSPFLYVETTNDLEQGDMVVFEDIKSYKVRKVKFANSKPLGVVTTNAKKGEWVFVQTVAHCKLPTNPNNYFKKLGI